MLRSTLSLWPRALAIPALLLCFTPVLRAGSLDASVMSLFPSNTRELGYADLNHARELSWFPQFESQLLPVPLYGFERFLASAEMRQTSPVDSVAWARIAASPDTTDATVSTGGQIVGVAQGDFESLQAFLQTQQTRSVTVDSSVLYAAGTGSAGAEVFFTLIDPNTLVFGPLATMKRLMNVRSGQEANLLSNDKMMTLVAEVNGAGLFWGVFDTEAISPVIDQLIPAVAAFPQAQGLLAKTKGLLIRVSVPSDIEIDFEAASASSDDVVLLSQLLQAALLYQSARPSANPALRNLLGALRVAPNGSLLDLSLDLTDEQVLNLIQSDSFVFSR